MGTEVLPFLYMKIERDANKKNSMNLCLWLFLLLLLYLSKQSNCFDSVKEAEWSKDAVRKQIYVCSHWGSGQHLWDPSTYFKLEPVWILSHKNQNNLKVCWDNFVHSTLKNKNTSCEIGSFLCDGERFGYLAFHIKISVGLEGGDTTILMWTPILRTCNNTLLSFLSRDNSLTHNQETGSYIATIVPLIQH